MFKNDLDITSPTTVEWEWWAGNSKCPRCGSRRIQYNTRIVLTTMPPQTLLRCAECDYEFRSNDGMVVTPSKIVPSVTNCQICNVPTSNPSCLCDECIEALRKFLYKEPSTPNAKEESIENEQSQPSVTYEEGTTTVESVEDAPQGQI